LVSDTTVRISFKLCNPRPPHLKALEEVEQADISGLVEALPEEGLDAVTIRPLGSTGWPGT
jgi:hypothetical protein